MTGLTTGNTLYDALILFVVTLLPVLAQRFGITGLLVAIGEMLVKLKPAPTEPPAAAPENKPVTADAVALAKSPAGFDWALILQLLLPALVEAVTKLFERIAGRKPSEPEVAQMRQMVAESLASGKAPDPEKIAFAVYVPAPATVE